MILQKSPNEPVKHIPVPEHRTKPISIGEFTYIGVLTGTRHRKVFRMFENATPSPNDELIPMGELPDLVRFFLGAEFDHLEALYFPKR